MVLIGSSMPLIFQILSTSVMDEVIWIEACVDYCSFGFVVNSVMASKNC